MDRTEKARELFHNGYNCAQAVVGAYSDLFDVEPELAMRMIEGFGGGMGRMRLTCGAVSAMVALVGMKYSKGVADDTETRTLIYGKVRELESEDLVEVWNDRGRMLAPVMLTEEIIPGVVAIAEGAWHEADKEGRDIAGSMNVLTSQEPTPLAKGNPQHTNLVEVKKIEREFD